jgi:acetoin utilization protein AcuB
MKAKPTVSKFMSTLPISIEESAGILEAYALMSANHFRHLPVVCDGVPIGILSDRDMKLAQGLHGVDLATTKVGDIARKDLFTVSPDSPLDEVAQTMAEKRIGSAVVIQNHKIVGIFTTTDALEALIHVLRA